MNDTNPASGSEEVLSKSDIHKLMLKCDDELATACDLIELVQCAAASGIAEKDAIATGSCLAQEAVEAAKQKLRTARYALFGTPDLGGGVAA